MKTIKSVSLSYKNEAENSDKVYHIQLVANGTDHYVNFAYGRRGGDLKDGTKTPVPVTLEEGEEIFQKLVVEKQKKGYK